jgi:hypothetical protein
MKLQDDVNIYDILYIIGMVKEETARGANIEDDSNSTARATASGFDEAIQDEEIYEELFDDYFELEEEDEVVLGKKFIQVMDDFLKQNSYTINVGSLDKMVNLVDIDELRGDEGKDLVYNAIYKQGYYYYVRYDEDDYIFTKTDITGSLKQLKYLFAELKGTSGPGSANPRKIEPGREVDLNKHPRSGSTKSGKSSTRAIKDVKGEKDYTKKDDNFTPSNRSMGRKNTNESFISFSEFLKSKK